MELTPVKITTIRTDQPLPFALWDKEGRLLARSGSVIDDRRELQTLLRAREDVYIDVRDSEERKRFHESRLVTMVMNDERIGKIARDQQPRLRLDPAGRCCQHQRERQ